jgi:hypothetical protein
MEGWEGWEKNEKRREKRKRRGTRIGKGRREGKRGNGWYGRLSCTPLSSLPLQRYV